MDTKDIRDRTCKLVSNEGISIPGNLPLLDEKMILRDKDEALSRLLCIHAVAAASCGFDKAKALNWIQEEQVEPLLTDGERRFLHTGKGRQQDIMVKVEGAWAIAWGLSFVPKLDFWKDCDDNFVALLPNLKNNQSSAELRKKARFRKTDEVIAACDLA